MEERPPGRVPGYEHSDETKKKISEAASRRRHLPSTKDKISKALQGRPKSESHRKKISLGLLDNYSLCIARLEELKSRYPAQAAFFEENEAALLAALQEVKSDKEIDDIKRYIETEDIAKYTGTLSYQYSSSSYHAQEDIVIALLDAARDHRRLH
jgi:hypothetical protein